MVSSCEVGRPCPSSQMSEAYRMSSWKTSLANAWGKRTGLLSATFRGSECTLFFWFLYKESRENEVHLYIYRTARLGLIIGAKRCNYHNVSSFSAIPSALRPRTYCLPFAFLKEGRTCWEVWNNPKKEYFVDRTSLQAAQLTRGSMTDFSASVLVRQQCFCDHALLTACLDHILSSVGRNILLDCLPEKVRLLLGIMRTVTLLSWERFVGSGGYHRPTWEDSTPLLYNFAALLSFLPGVAREGV